MQSLFSSEGLRTLAPSAAGIGMPGGRVANQSDPAVVRDNPASLVKNQRSQVQLNGSYWFGRTSYSAPDGATTDMEDTHTYIPSLFWAKSVSDSAGIGIGVSVPYGLTIDWPEDGPFRYVLPHENLLETIAFNAAAGFRLTEDISVGVGGELLYSHLELKQAIPWGLIRGNTRLSDGIADFDADGVGLGAYVGININPTDRQRLSLVSRTPLSVDHDGDFSLTSNPKGSGIPDATGFDSEIQYPGSVGIGYGIDLTPNLTLGFDFEWIQNSTHDFLPLDIGPSQSLLGQSGTELRWEDSVSFGTGAEWRVNDHWALRAGYLFSESPMPSQTFLPSVPANDRHMISVGVGFRSGDHSIDLAHTVALYPERHVSENVHSASFNGSYDFSWHVTTLSYSLRF